MNVYNNSVLTWYFIIITTEYDNIRIEKHQVYIHILYITIHHKELVYLYTVYLHTVILLRIFFVYVFGTIKSAPSDWLILQ